MSVVRLFVLCILQAYMVCAGLAPLPKPVLRLHFPRHGPLTDCPIPIAEKFVLEYMSLADGSPSRAVLEQRYGKANITRLVAKYKEDQANREWLESSTMACPGCQIKVEKSIGCNHVSKLEWGGAHANGERAWRWTDDMREMQAALLLPLWCEAERKQPVRAFLDAGASVLLEAVRLPERGRRVAADGGVRCGGDMMWTSILLDECSAVRRVQYILQRHVSAKN